MANIAANTALAVLQTALRERKLDRTLTTALPPLERSDAAACIPFDITALDAMLRGGLPRGQVSELAGSHSSGRTTLLLHLLGAATRGGEIAALVDTCDRLDVASASAAGIDLERLLWIRGEAGSIDQLVDRALKALNLVLQAGGFGVVVIDLADIPPRVLKTLPFTTWLRLQRIVEGSDTACLLVGPEPIARSAGGLTVMCTGRTTWSEQTLSEQTLSEQTLSGATQQTLNAAPPQTLSAAPPQTLSAASKQTLSGASKQTLSAASKQTLSGASKQTLSGASKQTLSAAIPPTLSAAPRVRRFTGLDTEIRVVSPRRRVDGETRVAAVANDSV